MPLDDWFGTSLVVVLADRTPTGVCFGLAFTHPPNALVPALTSKQLGRAFRFDVGDSFEKFRVGHHARRSRLAIRRNGLDQDCLNRRIEGHPGRSRLGYLRRDSPRQPI